MAAMRLEQVQRLILAKKYFGVMGTLRTVPTNSKVFFPGL